MIVYPTNSNNHYNYDDYNNDLEEEYDYEYC